MILIFFIGDVHSYRVPTLHGNPLKPGILTKNREKPWNLQILCFKLHFSRRHLQKLFWFTSLSYVHYQHKHWFKAKLTLDFIAFTWKIHGILCHKRSGNPASVFTHFEIFITKICMKIPGIWHKKPWKTLKFRTKNLEKSWHLVFGKSDNPVIWFNGWQPHETRLLPLMGAGERILHPLMGRLWEKG